MELKPGYKQTEVGVIPEDWEVKRLGEIGESLIGLTYKPEDVTDVGTLILRSSNIQNETLTFEDNVYVTTKIPDRIRVQVCDLLICVRNGSRDLIGKCALIDERVYGQSFGAFMSVFRSRYGQFVFYNFQSNLVRQQISQHLGATINQITNRSLNSFVIPFPPLPEQKAIAQALSDMDALISGLDNLIAKKRDIKQATMQQLLTGKTRLPEFTGEWEVKRLGDVGRCIRGVSYKGDTDLSPSDGDSTKRLLRSNNVQNSAVVAQDLQYVNASRVSVHQILQADDVLICMANGSKSLVGKAAKFILDDGLEYTFGAFMGCFRTTATDVDKTYVFYHFLTDRYSQLIAVLLAGSSINNLTPSTIESFEIPIPPLPEQQAIATVLSDIDAELEALDQRREKTRELKQAMMQELLTGRTRLV
jgi:type I restriction enzyme S subunit